MAFFFDSRPSQRYSALFAHLQSVPDYCTFELVNFRAALSVVFLAAWHVHGLQPMTAKWLSNSKGMVWEVAF